MCVQFAVYICVLFACSYNATVDAVSLSLAFTGHRRALCLFRLLYMFVPFCFFFAYSYNALHMYELWHTQTNES